ncbi:hypothetical protein MPRG_37850 [Mycobacterium paragordonae]|uniref:Uncharacterized protein n=1 Tax=Mycobacterium paragordonae TaxID=1389713 RepID=A0ABQ1C7Z4_9MYCO|nr:hypothetical protein MPRG_37850 [Mycobacterium paragordonae]
MVGSAESAAPGRAIDQTRRKLTDENPCCTLFAGSNLLGELTVDEGADASAPVRIGGGRDGVRGDRDTETLDP